MICKPRDHFQCSSSQCVPWSNVCDGIAHCDNKADEECDMCTNDLYTCKDKSRINCTLACSTLGYIPCQNYMDKKICASVMKRHDDQNYRFFNIGAPTSSFSSTQIGFILVLGFFVTVFIIFLIISYIAYKRRPKSIRKPSFERTRSRNNRSHRRRDSSTSSIDFEYPNTSNEDMNFIRGKSTPLNRPTEHFKNIYESVEADNKSIHVKTTNQNSADNTQQIDSNQNILTNPNSDDNDTDCHIYGDAPPSYKQSKYFPQADLTDELSIYSDPHPNPPVVQLRDHQAVDTNEEDMHVYANIEENVINNSGHVNSKRPQQSSNRKGKFQALKKHSSNPNRKATRNSDSSDSIEFGIGEPRVSSLLSSPIVNIAD